MASLSMTVRGPTPEICTCFRLMRLPVTSIFCEAPGALAVAEALASDCA